MKLGELTDVSLELPKAQIVIELPNGQRMATGEYYHDSNKRNEPIIVIKAGKKIGK